MKYITKIILNIAILIVSFTQIWVIGQEVVYPLGLEGKISSYIDDFINRDNKFKNLEVLPVGQVYIPPGKSAQIQEKLQRIAAYDVGSTGVKFKLMDVDPMEDKIVNVIYETYVPTKFAINEEDFPERIAIMAGLKTLVDEYFPHYSKIEHHGVATAGFRAAGERGERLAKAIAKIVGIDFKIIDQDYEGLLAYYGVLAKEPAFNPSKDIVWDVGGGSSQLVASEMSGNGEKMRFLGVAVGGAKFNDIVLNQLYGGNAESNRNLSENPMSPDVIQGLVNLVGIWLTNANGPFKPAVFTQEAIDFIKGKVSSGGKVYGIGAVHNFVVKLYVDNNLGAKPYYTKKDIAKILEMVADHNDDYIYKNVKKSPKADPKFTKFDVTSLILIYAMMDKFGIDKVYPVNVSNADGIAIKSVIDKKMGNNIDFEEENIDIK